MNKRISSSKIVFYLKSKDIVSSVKVLEIDELFSRSVIRIRCDLLPSFYHLDIRLIQTEKETVYSYQLFTDHAILRWDNAPHFPEIDTFPHHFHNIDGKIEPSSLKGVIFEDLNEILGKIHRLLISLEP